MKKDIENREDIDRLMRAFYAIAMTDPVIGYIFTDVAKLELDHHLPIIGDFWETLLLRGGDYARHGRNPLQVHGALDEKTRLLPEHFERWLMLFAATTDELFEGENAEFIKLRAAAISKRMLQYLDADGEVNSPHAAATGLHRQ